MNESGGVASISLVFAEALQAVLADCKPGAKIVDLCEKGDTVIRE